MHTEKKYLFIEVFAYLRQMRIYLQCDFQKDQLNTHTELFFYCQTCPWEQKTGFCAPCISDMFSNLTCSSHIKCWDIFFLFLSFFFFSKICLCFIHMLVSKSSTQFYQKTVFFLQPKAATTSLSLDCTQRNGNQMAVRKANYSPTSMRSFYLFLLKNTN